MSFSLVLPKGSVGKGEVGRWASLSGTHSVLRLRLGSRSRPQSAALADRRIALVIGNGKYENAGVLANPINDADAIADLLTKAGFDSVDRRHDLGVVEFKRAVREFVDRAANADVAVVYYSGHGLEIGGVQLPHSGRRETVKHARHGRRGGLARPHSGRAGHVKKLSLIILDACRENPFHPVADDARVTRGVSMGLAGVGPTVADTLIAFAAKAGSVSYDGDGRNSPFTTALLKYITEPGLDIRLALGKVRDDVLRARPTIARSLTSMARWAAKCRARAAGRAGAKPGCGPSGGGRRRRGVGLRMTERFASLDGWRAFLAVHPDGEYARRARGEIDKLLARQKLEAAKTEVAPTVVAKTEVAPVVATKRGPPLSPEDLCERDADRLVQLRANPTSDEASRFASELSCEKLRPQLSRLMESLGFAIPAPSCACHFAPRGGRPRLSRRRPMTAPLIRPPSIACEPILPSTKRRRSGAAFNANGCAPRRAC